MHRSTPYLAAALGLALAVPVHAQDFVGEITNQLQDLGFEQIEVRRTLLGRTRIVASSPEGTREIIVSTNSDEILRDFWQAAPGKSANRPLVDNRNSGSGSGGDNRSGSDDSGSAGSDDGNNDRSGSGRSNDSGSDDNESDDNDSDDNDSDDNDSDDNDSDDKDDGSDDSKDD